MSRGVSALSRWLMTLLLVGEYYSLHQPQMTKSLVPVRMSTNPQAGPDIPTPPESTDGLRDGSLGDKESGKNPEGRLRAAPSSYNEIDEFKRTT